MEKPADSFYRSRNCKFGLHSWCKDCQRSSQRAIYARLKKKANGIRFDTGGRKVLHRDCSVSIYWDSNMLYMLKRHFATTTNAELAELLGVSPRTMIRKARELGLQKDKGWLKGVWQQNSMLGRDECRRNGNSGWLQKGHRFLGNQYTGVLLNKIE